MSGSFHPPTYGRWTAHQVMIDSIITSATTIISFLGAAFRSLLNLVNTRSIATWSVAVFTGIIAHQIRNQAPSFSWQDILQVSGLYGPGSYYCWLIIEIVAVCGSNHGDGQNTLYMLANTLGAAIPSSFAAVSQLRCVAQQASCVQAQRGAFDRVVMLAWILNVHYLMQRGVNKTRDRREPVLPSVQQTPIPTWKPSLQTFIRIVLGVLYTAVMIAYDIQQGTLGKRLGLCLGPVLVCLVFPIIMVYSFKQSEWAPATINAGTILISAVYVCTPYKYRYDPRSPTAPFSAAKLNDLDQLAALMAGCLCLFLHILEHFEQGRAWKKSAWEKVQSVYRGRADGEHMTPLLHESGEEDVVYELAGDGPSDMTVELLGSDIVCSL